MKKTALILSALLIALSFGACGFGGTGEISAEYTGTLLTLQPENPTPDEFVTEEQYDSSYFSETEKILDGTAYESNLASKPPETESTSEAADVPATTAATTTAPIETTTVITTTTPVATTTVITTTALPVTTPATTARIIPPSTYGYTPLNFKEQRAMWISYLEFQRILKGRTKAEFKASVVEMYNNCVDMGINTVYVHARAHSDAYYQSDLYPWSENCTGTLGEAPDFDPFEILVKEAHDRGLSIHAWVNPMRGLKTSQMEELSDTYLIKKWYNNPKLRGKYIVEVDGVWYCSPAYSEVRNLITAGVKELVSKYDIDGVHIDDYFYPTTAASFDRAAFVSSGAPDLNQWRLDTVSRMVREMYAGIKSVNSKVLFGISPQGNIDNNYKYQYADVRKWAANSGYMDYLVPQIYFGYRNKTQPYEENLQAWCDMVKNPDIKLVVGLAAYKVGSQEQTGEWAKDTSILSRQIRTFKQSGKYGGAAFFRYDSMFCPASSISKKMRAEIEALKNLFLG